MKRAYKTELKMTEEQTDLAVRSFGVCRFLYNRFLAVNIERHAKGEGFLSGFDFAKYVNHELKKEFPWISECGSKAWKKSVMNAETAFKRFFRKQAKFPHFKKRRNQDVGLYFPLNGTDIRAERHRIKIPTFGWIMLKEKGYILDKGIINAVLTQKAGRFFVSVLTERDSPVIPSQNSGEALGIDMGLNNLAVLSNGKTFSNINKSPLVRKLEKRLKHRQRELSRRFESAKKAGRKNGKNIDKSIKKVQKLHKKLEDIRTDYERKCVNEIVNPPGELLLPLQGNSPSTKPSSITLENLNVSGMMRNRHLARSIASCRFHSFLTRLKSKAAENGIEVRQVSAWYPSSKRCSCCGHVKKELQLKDRIYKCPECGNEEDRDLNAALNLAKAEEYKII